MNKNGTIALLALIGVLAVAGAFFIYPQSSSVIPFAQWRPWKLGLDLVGGSHLIYEIDLSGVKEESRDSVVSGLRDVVEQRINLFGVSEPNIVSATEGESHRLIVELAGIQNVDEAIAQIGKTAHLDFREMNVDESAEEVQFIPTTLTGRYLERAQVVFDPTTAEPQISLQFNSEGALLFEALTEKNIGKQLCAFIDNAPLSCPRVNEAIPGGQAVITGQFTLQEAKELVNFFNAGALPAPITLINQQTISAQLGENSLKTAIFAGIGGIIFVMLFMMLYYRASGFGILAAIALLIYMILTLAFFKMISVTMTLAGIAGFLLSIGMAVDANILIFERIKEERQRKLLSATAAIEEGFRRAWPSIRDSNVTTIISAIILYYFTSSFVRGFALTLLVGVIISMFTAITVTRGLIRVCAKQQK